MCSIFRPWVVGRGTFSSTPRPHHDPTNYATNLLFGKHRQSWPRQHALLESNNKKRNIGSSGHMSDSSHDMYLSFIGLWGNVSSFEAERHLQILKTGQNKLPCRGNEGLFLSTAVISIPAGYTCDPDIPRDVEMGLRTRDVAVHNTLYHSPHIQSSFNSLDFKIAF